MAENDHLIQPSAPDCLQDDFVLDALYDLAFPDELESMADDRKAQNHELLPLPVLSSSSARAYDAIQILNFTSHIFRGLSSSRLQFNVRIKLNSHPYLGMLLEQKNLFAEASLSTPQRIISYAQTQLNSQQLCFMNEESALLTYHWHQDLRGKQIDTSATNPGDDQGGKKSEAFPCRKIHLEADKDGRLNYVVVVDIRQEFLSTSQAAHYDLDVVRDMALASIEVIHLLVELKDCSNSVVAGACSYPIYVTNFAFSIEERFSTSPFIKRLHSNGSGDPEFAWYCKNGGDNASIDVVVHLRDSKGRFVTNHSSCIPTTTQLVYSDGSPAPEMPLAPLKERKTATASSNPLFRRVRADPIIPPNQSSADFSFRIEEVSMHHLHKGGCFRVRVYTEEPAMRYLISPGIMDEVIIVRSKARKGELPSLAKKVLPRNLPTLNTLRLQDLEKMKNGNTKKGKIKCNDKPDSSTEVPSSSTSRKARKISVELPAPPINMKKSDLSFQRPFVAKIPTPELFRCLYNENNMCLWCQKEANECSFLQSEQHSTDCMLRASFLETLQISSSETAKIPLGKSIMEEEDREPKVEMVHSKDVRSLPPSDDLMMELSVSDAFLYDIDEHQRTIVYSPGDSCCVGVNEDVWPPNSDVSEELDHPPPALFRFHDFDTFYSV